MELTTRVSTSSSADFVCDLECLFRTLKAVERYVTFELESDGYGLRYVQAIVGDGGSVVLESIADEYIPDDRHRLGPAGEEALARLGFAPPSSDVPNWHLEIGMDMPGWPAMLAERTLRTFVDVHGWKPGDLVIAHAGLCLCAPQDLIPAVLPR